MGLNNQTNGRLELYNRFRQSLKEGVADEEFFDADDLVIIYDQAVDLDDRYVQVEALMRGYRYFPDNDELAQRRGFLYYSLRLDRGAEQLMKNSGDDSPMWQLLNLRLETARNPEWTDITAEVDKLMNTPGKFDDESVIQFVNAMSDAGRYQWLKDNEKALRKKTEYLPTLLYELYIVSDANDDSAYGMKLLEELTEIEPFNSDFWLALAQSQLMAEKYDDALASCDYALALSSDDVNVLRTKGQALLGLGRLDELEAFVDPLIENDPYSVLVELKVSCLVARGDTADLERAREMLRVCCMANAENRQLIGLAVDLRLPEVKALLDRHYTSCSDEERDDWFDWGVRIYTGGHPQGASCILEILDDKGLLDFRGKRLFVSALYTGERYDRCTGMLEEAVRNGKTEMLTPDLLIAGLLSYLHLGKTGECKAMVNKITEFMPLNIQSEWTISSTLETIGFSSFMAMLNHALAEPDGNALDYLDIFTLPDSYNEHFHL